MNTSLQKIISKQVSVSSSSIEIMSANYPNPAIYEGSKSPFDLQNSLQHGVTILT